MAHKSPVSSNQENDRIRCYPFNIDQHVLLVDGDKTHLEHHSKLLELCSYKVTTTNEGSKALGILREKKENFYFVLADTGVPEVNTHVFVETVRRKKVPLIYMAKPLEIKAMERACSSGACFFLEKPVHLSTMRTLWFSVEKERMTEERFSQLSNYIKMIDALRKECKAQDMIAISENEVEVMTEKSKAASEGTSKEHQFSEGNGYRSCTQPRESDIHPNVKQTCISQGQNRSYQEPPSVINSLAKIPDASASIVKWNQQNQQTNGAAEHGLQVKVDYQDNLSLVSDQNSMQDQHGNKSKNIVPSTKGARRPQEQNGIYQQKKSRLTPSSQATAAMITQSGRNLLNSLPILVQPWTESNNHIQDKIQNPSHICSVGKISEPQKTSDYRSGALASKQGLIQINVTEKDNPAIIMSPASLGNAKPVLENKPNTTFSDDIQAKQEHAVRIDYTNNPRILETSLPKQISGTRDNATHQTPAECNNPHQHKQTVGEHEAFHRPARFPNTVNWVGDVVSVENTWGNASNNRQEKSNQPIFAIGDESGPVQLGLNTLQDPPKSKNGSEQQMSESEAQTGSISDDAKWFASLEEEEVQFLMSLIRSPPSNF